MKGNVFRRRGIQPPRDDGRGVLTARKRGRTGSGPGAASRRAAALFTVLLRLRQARDEQGAAARAALLKLQDEVNPEALHRVRILARRLRYLAEVQDGVRGQQSDAPDLLRRLQDALGQLHDPWLLSRWAAGQAMRAASTGKAEDET